MSKTPTLPIDIDAAHKIILDLQGKLKALERVNTNLERDNANLQALNAEVTADASKTIANAAEQLGAASAIAAGMYAIGQWASGHIENSIAAMHIIHREGTLTSVLEEFLTATSGKTDKDALAQVRAKAEPIVKTHASNTELIKVELEKTVQLAFREQARDVMDRLLGLLPENPIAPGVEQ